MWNRFETSNFSSFSATSSSNCVFYGQKSHKVSVLFKISITNLHILVRLSVSMFSLMFQPTAAWLLARLFSALRIWDVTIWTYITVVFKEKMTNWTPQPPCYPDSPTRRVFSSLLLLHMNNDPTQVGRGQFWTKQEQQHKDMSSWQAATVSAWSQAFPSLLFICKSRSPSPTSSTHQEWISIMFLVEGSSTPYC